MNAYPQSSDHISDVHCMIFRYQLVFKQNGNYHHYIWCHYPPEKISPQKATLLVDLNNIFMPDLEIGKMICSLLVPGADITSIAIANCHLHNRKEIKHKLKASDISLYSKTEFFTDTKQAQQWLKVQETNCRQHQQVY